MADKDTKKLKFKRGGQLADGRTFKAGDVVPNDIDAKEMKVLRELDAIEE